MVYKNGLLFKKPDKETINGTFFKLKERKTTVKTEFVAGMTTFFAMVYILMVNANMFANPLGDGSNPLGVSYGAIYIAAALIYVGLLMMGSIKNVDWDNFKVSVPAFLTLAVMPFTYNISYGIAFGLNSCMVTSVFCGDIKKIKVSSWVIAMLVLTH